MIAGRLLLMLLQVPTCSLAILICVGKYIIIIIKISFSVQQNSIVKN